MVDPNYSSKYNNVATFITAMPLKDKSRIWNCVSEQLNIAPQQAHDYYHNTFVLQFQDDFAEFRGQLVELCEAAVQLKRDKTEAVAEALGQFVKAHPDKRFNARKTKQFIGKQVVRLLKKHTQSDEEVFAAVRKMLQ